MLLSHSQFHNFAKAMAAHPAQLTNHLGFDFESDGLSVYKGARAFIMGFTDPEGQKYCVRDMTRDAMVLFFSNPRMKYCPHNGKFELSFLREQFGVDVKGTLWDTEVMARVEHNNHMSYSLQNCAARIGLSKHEPMLEWLKKKGNKNAYHKAPAELIEPYVEQDAWLSWELARKQMETFRHWDVSSPVPIKNVVRLELQTTPHLFDMESHGLLVDVNYCQRARDYDHERAIEAKRKFKELAGCDFVDSRKTLQPVFDTHGIRYGKTALGNASFTEDALEGSRSHPLVGTLLAIRQGQKRASSYWENFLELEHNGIIHPSINQNRADTGRMSISDPSCQNWPTDEDDPEFPIRRAFVARPGCVIASADWAQVEFRKMCDEAEDMATIAKIQDGLDVHQEVADMASVKRSLAKNGRFAKLYGCGVPKLATTLGVSIDVAQKISDAIDDSSPRIAEYRRELINHAMRSPFGYDFLGRRFYFDKGFEYKAPNYRIQGACGEILKIAINDIGNFLKANAHGLSPDTFMLIPIHDEIVFNIHEKDLWILPHIKRLMIAADRSKKHLEMDVSIAVGPNFHDLEKVAV